MLKKAIPLIGSIILVTGCSSAQKASEVQAVRAPVAPYLKMNCQELASEQNGLLTQAEAARSEVDASYSSDKTAEVIAWVLFAPAVFAMDGNQAEAAKLASIKGQLESVQEAQRVNSCTSTTVATADNKAS